MIKLEDLQPTPCAASYRTLSSLSVNDAMLPRQPPRFLLADDRGAGRTTMAGLLIKELIARGPLPQRPPRSVGLSECWRRDRLRC